MSASRLPYNNNVIDFPVVKPAKWRFYDFVQPDGSNPIADWFGQHEEALDEFKKMLKDCVKADDHRRWGTKPLSGKKYSGMFEFRFFCENRQHRVIARFGPGRKVVVLLAGCYHKGKVYTPANALDTALDRHKMIERGEGRTHERPVE